MSGGLESRLDIAEHGEDFGRVGFLEEDDFAFLHRKRVGTGVKIGFSEAPGSLERVGGAPDFLVSFFEDFEGLIIVRLCLSYGLKHLDRLNDLTMLLFG